MSPWNGHCLPHIPWIKYWSITAVRWLSQTHLELLFSSVMKGLLLCCLHMEARERWDFCKIYIHWQHGKLQITERTSRFVVVILRERLRSGSAKFQVTHEISNKLLLYLALWFFPFCQSILLYCFCFCFVCFSFYLFTRLLSTLLIEKYGVYMEQLTNRNSIYNASIILLRVYNFWFYFNRVAD